MLRPPSYGPPRPGGFGLPYEYGPDLGSPYQGLPYGPELYLPPVLPYDPYPPPPGPFARREAPYGTPPFDMPDFEDDGGPYGESEAPAAAGPGSRWRYRSRDTRGSVPEPEESPEGGSYAGEYCGPSDGTKMRSQVCREVEMGQGGKEGEEERQRQKQREAAGETGSEGWENRDIVGESDREQG